MLTRPRFTMLCLLTVGLFLFGSIQVNAQHESSGGSKDMMGGSTVGGNTGRAPTKTSSTKPPVKTNTAATTVRKPPVTTTPPVKKPTVVKGPDANYYNSQGDQFFTAKNYTAALTSYQKAIELNPSLATAQYRIGWIKNDQEDYEEAIEPLNQAARLQPTYSAYYELGYAYRKLERYDEAMNAYKESLRIKSDYASTYHDIGWIYNEQKNYEDAATNLKQAIKLNPNFADAHNELGYSLRNLGPLLGSNRRIPGGNPVGSAGRSGLSRFG